MATSGSGRTLAAILSTQNGMAPPDVMRLIADTADALAAVHADGRHHGDIGPETILVSGDRVGLAEPVTASTPLPGTDPEESDVYALAVVAYRCLGGNPDAVAGEPPTFTPLPPTVPPPIAQAVHRALAHEPRFRPPSARRFARACRDALAGPVTTAMPAAAPAPYPAVAPIPAGPTPRRRRTLITVAVVALLALMASGALLWQPWGAADGAIAAGDAPASPDQGRPNGDPVTGDSPSTTDSATPGDHGSSASDTAGADDTEDSDSDGGGSSGDSGGDTGGGDSGGGTGGGSGDGQPADGMPDVIGWNDYDAGDAALDAGFGSVIHQYDESSNVEDCTVLSRDPQPGTPGDSNTDVVLVASGDSDTCWPYGP